MSNNILFRLNINLWSLIEGPDAITGLAHQTRYCPSDQILKVAKLIFKKYKIYLVTFKICSLAQYFYRVSSANPVIASGPSIYIPCRTCSFPIHFLMFEYYSYSHRINRTKLLHQVLYTKFSVGSLARGRVATQLSDKLLLK